MSYYFLALLIGVVAGLRALTPVAAVSWAVRLARLHLEGTWLAFLGYSATPYIFSLLALLELVNDKLPKTPSRKVPSQFVTRIVTGAFSGAAIGMGGHMMIGGFIAGAVGGVLGTLGGAEGRGRLAKAFGSDLPAALTEDAVAVLGATLIVSQIP